MYASVASPSYSVTGQSIGKVPVQYAITVPHSTSVSSSPIQNVHVEIIEQPASVGVRFRYKCEGRSAGCIRGALSSEKLKTYPTIKIYGYQGNASCVVSCVTKEGPPYYPHPHNLVGKQTTGNGVCFKTINTPDMICSFPNLGIQCVKKKDIRDSLLERQRLQVDPYGTGFAHLNQSNKINLNAVRLCFQVFIADSNGKVCVPLPPVISDPISDNKTVSDLNITKLSHSSTAAVGGQQIIILCDQVNKDDIEVIFYEEKAGNIVWSSMGKFSPQHVHRKAAIVVTTPPYKSMNLSQSVETSIQLRRPSDGAVGKPMKFSFTPLKYDPDGMLRKKQKCENIRFDRLLQSIGNEEPTSERVIKKAVRSRTKNNFQEAYEYHSTNPHSFGLQNMFSNPNLSYFDKEGSFRLPLSQSSTSIVNNVITVASSGQQLPLLNCHHSLLHSISKKEDILAVATEQIRVNKDNVSAKQNENETDDTLERLGSLDLGFDPADLDMNINEINFDSFPDTSALNISLSGEIK